MLAEFIRRYFIFNLKVKIDDEIIGSILMCKVKRRVAMILAMLMLISTNALAVETANPPALQEIENYALKYMRQAQNSETISVDCVQPFRDLDGNLTAYCVSFNDTDRAAGFLFLSLLVNGDPVVALGFDGHGPNDQVKESNGLLTAQSSENDFIYTGPGELYKRKNAQELTSLLSGENVSASKVEDEYRNYLESAHSSNRSVFASNGTIGEKLLIGLPEL